MNQASQLFAAATSHHQVGRYQEAARLYEQVIALNPNHASAWHLRGVTAWQQGQLPDARRCIERAIELAPRFVNAHTNLGLVLEKTGRLHEAADSFRRAIALDPSCTAALSNLGNILHQLGNTSEAIFYCRRAVDLDPQASSAHCNLAVALHTAGDRTAAARHYQQALSFNAQSVEALNGLGLLFIEQGQLEDAAACLEQAIQRRPDYAEAHNNMGTLRTVQDRFADAVLSFRRAIEISPNFVVARLNLANALNRQFQLDEAAEHCDHVLQTNPSLADAYTIRGDILKNSGRVPAAIEAYQRAIELRPDSAETHSTLLYALYFCPGYDSAAIFAKHRRANERHALPLAQPIFSHEKLRIADRRLRIGYVSAHFRSHCQALFTTPLFRHHNHEQFEIFCYSRTPRPDQVTEYVRSQADHWRSIYGLAEDNIADLVRQDRIDILVDLTMNMEFGNMLLFARKPAPIQICWLAYPGTTGLSAMDYRFTDPYLDPPGMFDRFYSEESFRLPHTFWCYDPLTTEPAVGPLPALDSGCITFGCLNNFCKVNEEVIRVWAAVMRAVACSRLILLAPAGSCRERTVAAFQDEGIWADRITFVPFQKRADYLATYQKIDIGLETLPANGHTTSLDAFWMGVPVPTLVGSTAVGRGGVSLLENLGLPELIAQTTADYVNIVSRLAADVPHLAKLRAQLRDRMQQSPLMNGPQFTRDIEAAYREIWRRWCEKDANRPAKI